ncbi:DM13 domain-containing protein [Flavobacterium sp.]|uniref:DM13 domain-containing protein n=1 Tax=Flavobacterium sp. TaxID=239 RepID=UPI00286D7CC8|nr:DM13 domain-containing protein [Flavobacterium sp.]
MKNFILQLATLFFFIYTNLNAQCTVLATNFGNNATTLSYNITGNVNVVLNANNTVTLNLMPNFMTAAGPDVRAYLIAPGSVSDAMISNSNISAFPNRIMFGIVSSSTIPEDGEKTFTVAIPSGQNISNYTRVLFYCQQFNAFWDFGRIIPFTTGNCSVLGTDSFEQYNFKMYPNPAYDNLNIDFKNETQPELIRVYNALGSVVLDKKNFLTSNEKINISQLKNGIYFVEITDKVSNQKTVKRFIKQD